MSLSNLFSRPKPPATWNYGIALILVTTALILTQWPALHLEAAPLSLLLFAVIFSAWLGGVAPGLLATALSSLSFYYYFLPPTHSLSAKPNEIPRFIFVVVSLLFIGLLSAGQRSATRSLKSARDDLIGTVQDLQKTNEALQSESRERKQAEGALRKAFEEIKELKDQLYRENLALKAEIDHASMFEEIVGNSEVLRRVLAQVSKVAQSDSTVLILGETGTGKELIARAIHKRSNRSSRVFIRVNCAGIPTSLIASELFGHEKGAFTGASQRRLGRFELANGGTIFLDEVGELPAETQIALLHVLQEHEFERVGSSQPVSVDVRVLAATNRDLRAAIDAGTFRQDLFYRLNVVPIVVPPLRERLDDIPLLVEYLIERHAKKAGKTITNVTKRTLEAFQAYDWPGNVRELQNVVERAIVLCESNTFSVDETWLKNEFSQEQKATMIVERGLCRLDPGREKEVIEAALARAKGRIAGADGAAARLGVPRSTLESKIRALDINKYLFKS
jgi:transcriptional regulator with GAF, ATPase, and Fis domain